jgi:hypothetical protein
VVVVKEAMRLMGRPGGWPRPPLLPLADADRDALRRFLIDSGALTGAEAARLRRLERPAREALPRRSGRTPSLRGATDETAAAGARAGMERDRRGNARLRVERRGLAAWAPRLPRVVRRGRPLRYPEKFYAMFMQENGGGAGKTSMSLKRMKDGVIGFAADLLNEPSSFHT